jgi:hypothetical protein
MTGGPLTLNGVPDYLLAEFGLPRGGAAEASYRCASGNPDPRHAPMADVAGPGVPDDPLPVPDRWEADELGLP